MYWFFRVRLLPIVLIGLVASLAAITAKGLPSAQVTVPPLDPTITWVLPSWDQLAGPPTTVLAMATRLRSEIGYGPKARIGLSAFLGLDMSNWEIDTTNPAAMEAALAGPIAQVDAAIANAEYVKQQTGVALPIGFSLITAIRERTDAVESGAANEDLRNVQWYHDWSNPAVGNGIATGWMTYSQYARKMRRVKEAYVRAFGRLLSQRMAAHPDILVAITGDGEIEMSYERFRDSVPPPGQTIQQRSWADYSPFAVAEFRDWLRGTGIYAAGQPLAGKAYQFASRYTNDAAPDSDSNNDGFMFNAQFGTSFTTWNLLHFNWSLSDAETAGALQSTAGGATIAGGFDAPRPDSVTILTNGTPFWLAFRQFRAEMVHRYNIDFARWITDGVPVDRWYSAQVPTDVLFGNPAADTGVRLLTSGSPHWTADIAPYGGMGVTGYNVNGGGPGANGNSSGYFDRTTLHAAPLVAARSTRWAIVEWNPSDPWSAFIDIYRADNELIRRYRPSLLMPYKINNNNPPEHQWAMFAPAKFVDGLRELVQGNPALNLPGIAYADGQPPRLSWAAPVSILVGTRLSTRQLNASASIAGTFTYAIRTGATTTGVVSGSTMPPVGVHTLIATFSPTDTNYQPMTAEVALTVTALPALIVSPQTTRRFAGTGALTNLTPPQPVTVTFSGPGAFAWSASADATWVSIASSVGTGSGQFRVGINPAQLPTTASAQQQCPPGVGSSARVYCATVTVTANNVEAPGRETIPVVFTLQGDGENQTPEGQVDTPGHTAVGIVGAIGVTGWVVDDQGVTSVKVYRNCLPFDDQASCQMIRDDKPIRNGATRNVVLIGDAAFLAGARPDVETAYPTHPMSNRAGWGFLMLTPMLPNVSSQVGYGGQGTLDLYVYATDTSGQTTLLGRNASDDTPTRITMDNTSIAKPFGAIDTPAQGATVSGVLHNFGWALTPDSNTTADGTDILIPPDGATMTVFIDGEPTALIAYNQCRGTVGNPVTPGFFCNDDVANIFGAATPQAALMPRGANATRFRNLDVARGAIGAFTIDTTTLSNGLHTIAWSVTDSANRTEGIGSRFFNVLNAGADEPIGGIVGNDGSGGNATERRARASAPPDVVLDAALRAQPAVARGLVSSLATLSPGEAGVWYRTGFDLMVPWNDLAADAAGSRYLSMSETGRLELWLGLPVEAGYLVANGTLRDLPVGASVQGARFSWAPPAGYSGTYQLTFVRGAERIDVTVSIGTKVH